jgi:hypothetical protein
MKMRDMLARQASEDFVGRRDEMAVLLDTLERDSPVVVHIHGIGGIGKTRLLDAVAHQARARGVTVVRLDCRSVEPTERGFLRELGAAVGGELRTAEDAAERLRQLGARVLLALDTYEVYRMMDTWLRQVFVPTLHDNVRVLFFGREAPVAAWHVSPGWQGLFQSIRLEPLNEQEARELLMRSGISQADAPRINRFARGHPLACKLAAAAALERPELKLQEVASQHVVAELTRLYLADVQDPLTREALDVAAVLRRTTRSLLGAMLPDAAPQDAYERLLALPFVEHASDGLIVHDAVQQAIANALHAADPSRYRALRRAAWRQLRREMRTATKGEIWRYTADLLYQVETPIIREAFFPSNLQPYAVEPARPDDGQAIQAITERHEGPRAAAILREWWARAPRTFRAIRDRDGALVGYYQMFDPSEISPEFLLADPIVRNWWQHLQYEPLPERQRVLFCRRWLAADAGEAPSKEQAACWLDIKGSYAAMRSVLRRIYCTAVDAATYAPVLQRLRFQILPQAQVELDGRQYHSAMLDFGPGLFSGWLTSLVGLELGVEQEDVLDVGARELVLNGQRIGLTPLEFGVIHYLHQREGKVVTRISLLEDVWGYDYTGGSNVVDAKVWSLRKKLGERAAMIETVPGAGYRFRRV